MAVLIATTGPVANEKFALSSHRLLMIGRDASCSIQITDPQLSRNHLQIRFDESSGRHFAIDFDSKNGVFVNGRRIETETELADDDVIAIGGTTFVYSLDESREARHVLEIPKRFGQGHVKTVADEPIGPFSSSDASAEVRRDKPQ